MENATLQSDWKTMIRRWSGSVAVGSTGCVYLLRKKGKPLYIKVPDQALPNNVSEFIAALSAWCDFLCIQETAESIVRAVAWAVHPVTPTTPVLIIAASRSIFIYDLDSTSFIGKLRGHGGVSIPGGNLYVVLVLIARAKGNYFHRCASILALHVSDNI